MSGNDRDAARLDIRPAAETDPIATTGDNGETIPNPHDEDAIEDAVDRVEDLEQFTDRADEST